MAEWRGVARGEGQVSSLSAQAGPQVEEPGGRPRILAAPVPSVSLRAHYPSSAPRAGPLPFHRAGAMPALRREH